MPKHIGYMLNSDKIAEIIGADPAPVCRRCYARMYSVNGHRAPRPYTKRMLGISDITGTEAGKHTCRHCGQKIG